MRPLQIKDQIRQAVLSSGFELIKEIPVQKCDFAVRHPKFALNGFFKLFSAGKELIKHWIEVQEEVRENLELHAKILNRHNTYLVFMLPIEELPPTRNVQAIISDEYVCRKLIAPIEDKNIQKSLIRVPFYPLEIPELPKKEIPQNVIEALANSDFPYDLISDLAGRVSERTILRKLKGSLYKHKELKSKKKLKETPPEGSSIYSTRVKNLCIKNFRGIGKKIDLDMDADIIIIYGQNGTGKTSIIDAIEWTITGEVERLWKGSYDKPVNTNESLVNLFSKERFVEVKVAFSKNGKSIVARRYIDLSKSRRSYPEIGKRKANDKTMIKEIVGINIPKVDVRRLRRVFLRSHFLGQNAILEFISQNPEDRYDAFSHMVGTQDYILFNEKIYSVIRSVERELEIKLRHKYELNGEVKNISERINTKKQAFEKLKRGIKEEASTRKLMNEIQMMIKELNIEVPEFLFQEKKELPEIEVLDKMIDIVSNYSQMSNSKINALSNLLIKAKNEENRTQEIEKDITNLEELTRSTNELQKLYKSKETDLRIIQKELIEYSRQKESHENQIVNIKWLINTLPKYRRIEENLANEQEYIRELSKKRNSIQIKAKSFEEKSYEISENFKNSKKEIEDIEQTLRYLLQIKEYLPAWKENSRQISHIAELSQQLRKEITQLQKKKSELEKDLKYATDEIKAIESKLDTEKEKQNRKLQLVTKLKEYLDSPDCPFCGHNWERLEDLTKQVEKRLLHLASMLHDLEHYNSGKIEDLKPMVKSLIDLAYRHENLLKKKNQLERQIKGVDQDIELRLKRISQLEDEKVQLNKKIIDWGNTLKYLKAKHPEFEVQIIPDRIQILKLLKDYESRLDVLRVRKEEIKKKGIALDEEIKSVENTKKDIEEQINSHQKKESDYVVNLEQINEETTKRGLVDLMSQNVRALQISIDKFRQKAEAVKEDMDKRKSKCEEIEVKLTDMERNLKKLNEKKSSLDKRLKELKDATEIFRTDLKKEGILPSEKLKEVINEIEDKRQKEIKYFQKCKQLQSLSQQLKSMVTMSQIKRELNKMQEEEAKKENTYDNIAFDYQNLLKWAEILNKLKKLAEEKRKAQEKNHFEIYSPTANLVYSRLNAHPLFNKIILEVGERELKVLAQSSRSERMIFKNKNRISLRQFFSEAQLNIAALSIFFATALHQKWSGFKTIIIDDPVQNMDDFHGYAFLDLVRGLIMNGHQFVLTTCNRELYKLMLVKFRDLNKTGRNIFKAYRLKGIYEEGPELIRDC